MKIENKLLGYYNYTVVLTYIGMLSGFVGILSTFSGDVSFAIRCLMVAGFCDMFDGAIASTMNRTRKEKNFGIQIDSLSDLICFGVLPGAIGYVMNRHLEERAVAVTSFYVLCALIRLAYFNVDEAERQKEEGGSREIYYGMPVTMSALLLPLLYALLSLLSLDARWVLLLLALSSALFLLPFQVRKPKLFGKLLMVLCGGMEVMLVSVASFLSRGI